MRKTKIVCTLGPSTDKPGVLEELIYAGLNVARFNFSHGTHEEHLKRYELLKELREKTKMPIGALLDTKGPEIRTGNFVEGSAFLKAGQNFTFKFEEVEGTNEFCSLSYKNLYEDVVKGSDILIDDGLIGMKVLSVENKDIICQVLNDGKVSNHKGVNVPGITLSLPYLNKKDIDDIHFGIKHDFDFIATSFTRNADDLMQVRQILDKAGSQMKIIAKIENSDGVENIDEILSIADGIMVARGDMGVEIPLEEIPVLQKILINKAYSAGKHVITATQMLDSMIKNPRPTRAETTDVANAIFDGTSAIMLSGETAAGAYPVRAVETMATIALRTEQEIDYSTYRNTKELTANRSITDAISHATCSTAQDLKARAILTVTKSGKTARMISKYRPGCPIIACTTEERVQRQLTLSWGVTPIVVKEQKDADSLFDSSMEVAQKHGLLEDGDIVAITAGVPIGISGTTNLLKVAVVGNILVSGKGIGDQKVVGNLCVCKSLDDIKTKFKKGDILVVPYTSNDILQEMKGSIGLIVEAEGNNSHAAVAGLALDLPVIVGATSATSILKDGISVILDCATGQIRSSDNL